MPVTSTLLLCRHKVCSYVKKKKAHNCHWCGTLSKGANYFYCEVKWPSMVSHTWNLCSAFNPSKCAHTVVSSEQTHTQSGGQPFLLQRLWEQWVGIEGKREHCTFTPPNIGSSEIHASIYLYLYIYI